MGFLQAHTDNGEGTTENAFDIRLARAHESPAVLDLLKRSQLPEAGLSQHGPNVLVAVDGNRVIGSAALEAARAPGYSMIELVIAIVIMGVLVSIAWLRMGPAVRQARVRSAATVVATDLQYAQMLAVRQRRPVAVIVDNSVRSYIIRLRDSSLTFRDRYFGQDTDYLLDSLSANPPSVVLFPSGVAAATTTFTVSLGGYTRHVRLTRAGQVRILP